MTDIVTAPQEVTIKKGTKVLVRRMNAELVSLSGMQMKTGVTIEEFEGVVTHIYGDHPTTPTKVTLVVKKGEGTEVEVDQKHIAAVIKETS